MLADFINKLPGSVHAGKSVAFAVFLFYTWTEMKKILLATLLIITAVCCKKSPGKMIAGRWEFKDASPIYSGSAGNNPETSREPDEEDAPAFSTQGMFGNRLILRSDGTFDVCLLQAYMHGNWRYDEKQKQLKMTNERGKDSFTIKVDSVGSRFLELDVDSFFIKKVVALSHKKDSVDTSLDSIISCRFFFIKSTDRYSSLDKDPYSIVNNQWRVKPGQPESDAMLKQRVLNHLKFLQLIFKDALDKNKEQVTYNWFNTPLIIANNGVALKFFDDIKEDWSKNFYDTAEARKGYWELNKAFRNKIKYLQTDNYFEKKTDMFQQMINNVQQN